MAGHEIESEVWFCVDMKLFLMNQVSVGHDSESEVRLQVFFADRKMAEQLSPSMKRRVCVCVRA